MIRLGGHGLPVGSEDPFAFARAHRDFGYGAAYCPPVELSDAQRLADIERAFAAEDVVIAEVHIWKNLIAVEPDRRKAHVDLAIEKLAIAEEVGANCAISYIGTYAPNSDYAPHPSNLTDESFELTVETARQIIDAVKPTRTKFTLEMMQYAIPDSVEQYVELIRAVDRPGFAAHLDPVNWVMTPRVYWNTGALINECFDKLGPWLVSCHAKDITLHHRAALHLDEVMIGQGALDYATFLRRLEAMPHQVPLMIEHVSDPEYAIARDTLCAKGNEIGVEFVHRPDRRG